MEKKDIWRMLGPIKVECPYCGHVMKVQTIGTVRCYFCNRTFKVIGKKVNRIVWASNPRLVAKLIMKSREAKKKKAG